MERNLTVKILMKLTAPIVICILGLAYCDKKIIVSEYLLKRETQRLADYNIFNDMEFVFAYCSICDKRFPVTQKNLPINLKIISGVLEKLKQNKIKNGNL